MKCRRKKKKTGREKDECMPLLKREKADKDKERYGKREKTVVRLTRK